MVNTCTKGHKWQVDSDVTTTGDSTLCPVCAAEGTPTLMSSLSGPLDQNDVATRLVNSSAKMPSSGATEIQDIRVALKSTPGTVAGYEILDVLGRGGMGVVYKAKENKLGRIVALKMLLSGGHAGAEELARFRAEAEAVARFQHPHIVQIYQIGDEGGHPFFTMEFVQGGSLSKKLSDGKMTWPQAAELVEKIARAIHYAHQRGVVHRDLKPGNILMDGDDTPKITDFGLAKLMDDDSGQTRDGQVLGTPNYMAPEQAEGRINDIGTATDVYAVGAILFDILTGKPPFKGETPFDTIIKVRYEEAIAPSKLNPSVPPDLETICLKCLAKDPPRRYESANALADDLRRYIDGEPILARPVGSWERAMKWAKRRPAVAALVGVSAVAVVAFFVVVLLYNFELQKSNNSLAEQTKEAEKQRDYAQEQENKANKAASGEKAQRVIADTEREKAERATKDAVKAQKLAEANFQKARNAVDQMLTRLSQDHLAHVPGMSDERKRLLLEALKFYEAVPSTSNDPKNRAETARAFRRVGDIHVLLGSKAKEDEHAYKRAIEIADELSKESPDNDEYSRNLALCYFHRGQMFKNRDLNLAEKDYDAALLLEEKLLKKHPGDARADEVARILNDLALVYRNTDRAENSRKFYLRALTLQKALDKKTDSYQLSLAGSYNDLGNLELASKALNAAKKNYVEARDIFKKLHGKNEGNIDYKRRLGAVFNNLGMTSFATAFGEKDKDVRDAAYKQAVDDMKTSLDWRSQLVISFPTVPDFRQDLANTYGNLAGVYIKWDKLSEAEKAFGEALKHQNVLVDNFKEEAKYKSTLGGILDNFAILQRIQNKKVQAFETLEKALAYHQAAINLDKSNYIYKRLLCIHYVILAETYPKDKMAEAANAVEELARVLPDDGAELFRAARIMAAITGKAEKDKGKYADRTLALLNDAFLKKCKPMSLDDDVFKPVNMRDDFKKLQEKVKLNP